MRFRDGFCTIIDVTKHSRILFLGGLFLCGCAAKGLFYFPNSKLYVDPDKIGIPCELVTYPSVNGKTLYGLYFNAVGDPVGTAVHFHGNANNVSDHFPLALFLRNYGYDVLCFDYQGFGASEGKPSPANAIDDGLASVRYAQGRMRAPGGGVVIFAQSVGVAAAAAVAAKEPLVRAAVLEGGFDSFRTITRVTLRRSWVLFPFSAVVPALTVRRTWDPVNFIAQISPRPLLFIHGTTDRVVPPRLTERLYARAEDPKELWLIPGANHLQCHRVAGKQYEKKIDVFFRRALGLGPVATLD